MTNATVFTDGEEAGVSGTSASQVFTAGLEIGASLFVDSTIYTVALEVGVPLQPPLGDTTRHAHLRHRRTL